MNSTVLCKCQEGLLENIAETAPLRRADNGEYQFMAFYQCNSCNSFYKRKRVWYPEQPWKNSIGEYEPYITNLSKNEIFQLASKSYGDIPKNIEDDITKGRQ